jgi:phospholipid/cholesterol/gamma-HCH transport system permease protein
MDGFLRSAFADIGGMTGLAWQAVRRTFTGRFERELWIEQAYELAVGSLTITNVTLLFTGMVLAVQTAYSLSAYGGTTFVGDLLSLAIVRELGPVLTAADPVRKLVVPRVGVLTLTLPLLTVLADLIGLFGGMLMAIYEVGQGRVFFVSHVLGALSVHDLASGLGKSLFFGFFIGVIACYNGMTATGGADGVGKATTRTVVTASISVIISDFFLTKLFMIF